MWDDLVTSSSDVVFCVLKFSWVRSVQNRAGCQNDAAFKYFREPAPSTRLHLIYRLSGLSCRLVWFHIRLGLLFCLWTCRTSFLWPANSYMLTTLTPPAALDSHHTEKWIRLHSLGSSSYLFYIYIIFLCLGSLTDSLPWDTLTWTFNSLLTWFLTALDCTVQHWVRLIFTPRWGGRSYEPVLTKQKLQFRNLRSVWIWSNGILSEFTWKATEAPPSAPVGRCKRPVLSAALLGL